MRSLHHAGATYTLGRVGEELRLNWTGLRLDLKQKDHSKKLLCNLLVLKDNLMPHFTLMKIGEERGSWSPHETRLQHTLHLQSEEGRDDDDSTHTAFLPYRSRSA